MDPNNVLNRQILPVLNRCAPCKRPKDEHTAEVAHKYDRDESLRHWQGCHAFRRGLATNWNRLGVSDKTVQAILRHANVATTQTYYTSRWPRIPCAPWPCWIQFCALDSVSTADAKPH